MGFERTNLPYYITEIMNSASASFGSLFLIFLTSIVVIAASTVQYLKPKLFDQFLMYRLQRQILFYMLSSVLFVYSAHGFMVFMNIVGLLAYIFAFAMLFKFRENQQKVDKYGNLALKIGGFGVVLVYWWAGFLVYSYEFTYEPTI